jgi:hypothetical protein
LPIPSVEPVINAIFAISMGFMPWEALDMTGTENPEARLFQQMNKRQKQTLDVDLEQSGFIKYTSKQRAMWESKSLQQEDRQTRQPLEAQVWVLDSDSIWNLGNFSNEGDSILAPCSSIGKTPDCKVHNSNSKE